ncbi:hypothetical protein [Streptomyces sp. NPDC046988]
MILLAILLPVVMMAFLFAADALEDLIFPPPAAPEDDASGAAGATTTSP